MTNFDGAICLCLDKRWVYWEELERQCHKKGWKFKKFIVGDGVSLEGRYTYDYVDNPNPPINMWGYGRDGYKHHHYNAFMSHQGMLERVKELGWERSLFLEDDAYITNRFDVVMEMVQPIIDMTDWDMLYLGWWFRTDDPNIEKEYREYNRAGIAKMIECGGFHGVIVRNTMYNFLQNLPPINPIDAQLNACHPRIKSYYIYPKIIHVRTMYSSTEGCVFNREHL